MAKSIQEKKMKCNKHNRILKNRKDKKGKFCVECQQMISAMKRGRGK